MAKQGMGKSMNNRECNWIRPRLPLWVDDGDGTGRPAAHGEGGDLSTRELRHIERHLLNCGDCSQYRASMNQALGALAVAAGQLPAVSEAPSLWPALQLRIASRNAVAGSLGSKASTASADRSARPWGDLDESRPLRQAWIQDMIRETMAGRDRRNSKIGRVSRLILKVGAAAAVLIGLIEMSIVRRQWQSAFATIQANAVPLADPVIPPISVPESARETSERDTGEVTGTQVAEAEPPRPVEASSSGVDAVAAPKSPPPTRFGFDLEHGTPMPPDSREAKPVY